MASGIVAKVKAFMLPARAYLFRKVKENVYLLPRLTLNYLSPCHTTYHLDSHNALSAHNLRYMWFQWTTQKDASLFTWSDYHKKTFCPQQEWWNIIYVWLGSDTGWIENTMHLNTKVDNYMPSVKSNIKPSHFACPFRHKQYIIYFEILLPY